MAIKEFHKEEKKKKEGEKKRNEEMEDEYFSPLFLFLPFFPLLEY